MGTDESDKLNRRTFLLGLTGLGLLSWNFDTVLAFQPFQPFTFAYVTDIHLCNDVADSYKLTRESQLFLQQLVKELNAEKLDFVVFGGDQVETIGKDEVNWQLFLDVLQGLNAPWTFILGEADVSGNSVDKRKTFGPDWKSRGFETDTAYWSHNISSVPNVHLIGLDTSIPNSTIGGVSQKQLDWLKQDLEANKKSFTIVFTHHPLLPPPPYDGGAPWDEYVIPDGGSVREVIGAYPNVKMVLSGHTHINKVQKEKDVWHISSASLVVYPCSYRLFEVAPDVVTMETRQIGFPALIKKARKELIDSGLAGRYSRENPAAFLEVIEGTREDRNALIPMASGPLEPYSPKKARKVPQQKEKIAEPPKETVAEPPAETVEKKSRWRRKKKSPLEPAESAPKEPEPGPAQTIDDLLKEPSPSPAAEPAVPAETGGSESK